MSAPSRAIDINSDFLKGLTSLSHAAGLHVPASCILGFLGGITFREIAGARHLFVPAPLYRFSDAIHFFESATHAHVHAHDIHTQGKRASAVHRIFQRTPFCITTTRGEGKNQSTVFFSIVEQKKLTEKNFLPIAHAGYLMYLSESGTSIDMRHTLIATLSKTARLMLTPDTSHTGVGALKRWRRQLPVWPTVSHFDIFAIRLAQLWQEGRFLSGHRMLYADYLDYAAKWLKSGRLKKSAADMRLLGSHWHAIISRVARLHEQKNVFAGIISLDRQLDAQIEREETFWKNIKHIMS